MRVLRVMRSQKEIHEKEDPERLGFYHTDFEIFTLIPPSLAGQHPDATKDKVTEQELSSLSCAETAKRLLPGELVT